MEQNKFTYSSLGKALEREARTIEDQGWKRIKSNEKSNVVIKTRRTYLILI